jgi:hypothetical protein
MSRGPGKLQRRILAALERHQAFYARDLLPLEPTRAAYHLVSSGSLGSVRKIGGRYWASRAKLIKEISGE